MAEETDRPGPQLAEKHNNTYSLTNPIGTHKHKLGTATMVKLVSLH